MSESGPPIKRGLWATESEGSASREFDLDIRVIGCSAQELLIVRRLAPQVASFRSTLFSDRRTIMDINIRP
ncbi:hypothetical protein FS749_002510 [Ceratobasidium sp. UAMH 11750]|nr:hypothetical protein FS749_002510 [Ceratobasidium sp. UAMH 11750]